MTERVGLTLRMHTDELEALDNLVADGYFSSRSAVVRELLRSFLFEERE